MPPQSWLPSPPPSPSSSHTQPYRDPERLIAEIYGGDLGFSNYTHGQPHTPVFQEQELKLVELNHNVNSAKSKVCCTLETKTASHASGIN